MKLQIELPLSALTAPAQTPPEIQRRYARMLTDERESDDFSVRRQHEAALTHFVRNGDVEGLDRYLFERHRLLTVGQMASDALLQARYMLVSSVTLYSRAAIEGGLPETEAMVLSDAYIDTIDRINDPEELYHLSLILMRDYAARVHDHRHRSGHPAVNKCCDYISAHLHEAISMAQLCRHSGYSESYLTACFKRETGLPPTQYILRERLAAAAHMLQAFDHSIQTIAATFAFPSASSFAATFRRHYGCTPSAYRKAQKHP